MTCPSHLPCRTSYLCVLHCSSISCPGLDPRQQDNNLIIHYPHITPSLIAFPRPLTLTLWLLLRLHLLRLLGHDVLKLRPERLDRRELVANLCCESDGGGQIFMSGEKRGHTAITASKDLFSLLMFARTCSKLCSHGNNLSQHLASFVGWNDSRIRIRSEV
ncbi:hypothetical protein VTJ49DRAFT_7615 [Mycothermus thermophilus]|uniref:Uncharacterized protein n=1 Tax=Humicola insolens TaxID=85995 RepID=A0ABR3VHC6_HUMIN